MVRLAFFMEFNFLQYVMDYTGVSISGLIKYYLRNILEERKILLLKNF